MKLAASILLSFITVTGFRFEITKDGFALRNTMDFAWLLLFLAVTWVLFKIFSTPDRRLKVCAAGFGILIALFTVVGASFEKRESLFPFLEGKSLLFNFLHLFFSYAVLYFCCAWAAFRFLSNRSVDSSIKTAFSWKRVLIFWCILILCYLPWYLFCYPGILTYDSGDQIRDALSVESLSDFHTAFGTLLIRLCLGVSRIFSDSTQTGVGLCTFLQMLIMTFVLAVCCERIRQSSVPLVIKILCYLWMAFYPVNNLYSVTLWKDILFSIVFLGLLLCIDAALSDEDGFFSGKRCRILLLCILVLLPLFRHNGIVISLVTALILPFYFKRHQRTAACIGAAAVMLYLVWHSLVIPSITTDKASPRQSLSIPLQQIARTLYYHHDEIDPDEAALWRSYFTTPEIWTVYSQTLADPVKNSFRDDEFSKDPGQFFKAWFNLGVRYPLDYIEAFLHNNFGYWYPETHYWISSYGVIPGKPDIDDVHTAPIYTFPLTEAIYNFYAYGMREKYPLIPLFFSRGACFWLWIFCGFYCLYHNRRCFVLVIPGLVLWLTIVLFSPVYAEFRYVYGLFTALPLLLVRSLSPGTCQGKQSR